MCYQIKVYEDSMYTRLVAFLDKCFPESGRELDINGKYAIYKDTVH